jgi:hypothetical protein
VALVLLATALGIGCAGDPETGYRQVEPSEAADAESGTDEAAEPTKLSDIRDAEDEGRDYQTSPSPERRAPAFEGTVGGDRGRVCVEMSGKGPTRSGEFVAEIFYLYEDGEAGEWGAKMPWAPLHLQEEVFANGDVSGVVVRAASLDEPSKISTQKFTTVAGFEDLGSVYTSYVRLPGEGPWRMVATSGPDWGCFDLEPTEITNVRLGPGGVWHLAG